MSISSTERRARPPIPQHLLDPALLRQSVREGDELLVQQSVARPEEVSRVAGQGEVPLIASPPPLEHFDYYCGSQAAVYFGEILIEECSYVAYNLISEKIPIHSYSSRLYNTLAEGPVLVRGKFGINLKEASYMYLIQAWLADRGRGVPERGLDLSKAVSGRRGAIISRLLAKSDQVVARDPNLDQISDLLNVIKSFDETEFQRLATALENRVWGGRGGGLGGELRGAGGRDRADEFPKFDIYLTFGDIDDPGAPSTVRRIMNAELLGHAIQISPDGTPIAEHHEFVAQTII